MNQPLAVTIGYATNKGVKPVNQDFAGSVVPKEPQLSAKGIVLAMADGISSSDVSQEASESAVLGFLEDYYCTSDSWSVKSSAQKVIRSINSLLCAQTQNSPHRFNKDKGYVCTFSALILKSNTAHILHTGDTRIYRLANGELDQLTEDHRKVVSTEVSYLTRGLGIDQNLEIDYQTQSLEKGDIYILATDGIYEFIEHEVMRKIIAHSITLQHAAGDILAACLEAGSNDNLSIQIVRVDHVPNYELEEVHRLTSLPLPPRLNARMIFDGFEIIREIYISSRSHVFLAKDIESEQLVVIKTPSTELRSDTAYLEQFMLEEWIAKRVTNPYVAKAVLSSRKRNYLYLVTEYIDGISLEQWMIDNPKPSLIQVRSIVEQIAKGLQAFHRQEMIHQDIRPKNIMIDSNNTVKIIDFGSTYIAGVSEYDNEIRGTMRYSAPEYFLGKAGTQCSDLYSLAVITYQMLSGSFPYGTKIAQAKSFSAQKKLNYQTLIDDDSELPAWVDDALYKALQIDPLQRYQVLSEFIHDLKHPSSSYVSRTKPPLIQRDPVMFWQGISFGLFILLVIQLAK